MTNINLKGYYIVYILIYYMSNTHICPYCNKSFSKTSNLVLHLNTAKYCLNIREVQISDRINYTCEGCLQGFNLLQSYEKHITTCKDHYAHTKIIQLRTEYEAKILVLEEKCRLLEFKLNVNPEYTNEFNKLLHELPFFTDINLKQRINTINYVDLANTNGTEPDKNFIAIFIRVIKDMTFCTDTTRHNLIIKREENKAEKIKGKSFIIECFTIAEQEITRVIHESMNYCRDLERSNMTEEDSITCYCDLYALSRLITQKGPNKLVSILCNSLSKNCKQLARKYVMQA